MPPLSRILPAKVATDELRTLANPFVERLIGTLQRKYLDWVFFGG